MPAITGLKKLDRNINELILIAFGVDSTCSKAEIENSRFAFTEVSKLVVADTHKFINDLQTFMENNLSPSEGNDNV